MTEMRVVDLCTCRQTSKPMVLLEDVDRSRWLSFYLPMNEANRLARVLGKTCYAGVPIFDLIGDLGRKPAGSRSCAPRSTAISRVSTHRWSFVATATIWQ